LWQDVQLEPGANALRVTAAFGGTAEEDAVSWTYRGTPGTVRIKAGDLTGFTTTGGARYGSDMYFTGGTPVLDFLPRTGQALLSACEIVPD
jgi:beta-galactosidase